MKSHCYRTVFLILVCLCNVAQAAETQGVIALEAFLSKVQSGRAEFTQSVQSPAKQGEAQGRVRSSSGSFEFSRPNRFKFLYKKPFEQALVSDGQTLWLHDVDLNQVSTRPLGQAMNGTPAVLIASGADVKRIQTQFDLSELGEKDGIIWLKATPKAKDGALQSIELGFKNQAALVELASLRIVDGFGQRSNLVFSKFEGNPKFSDKHFAFTPPKGVDVLR
jgi:outer membrane lipoprotein carrier protein